MGLGHQMTFEISERVSGVQWVEVGSVQILISFLSPIIILSPILISLLIVPLPSVVHMNSTLHSHLAMSPFMHTVRQDNYFPSIEHVR